MRANRVGGWSGLFLGTAVLGAALLVAAPPAWPQADADEEEAAEDTGPAEDPEAEEDGKAPEDEVEPSEDPGAAAPPGDEDESEADVPEESEEAEESAPASPGEEADDEAKWRERHQQMLDAVRASERRMADAEEQRGKVGNRHTYGGRSRAEIVAEHDTAQRALQRAQRDLDRFYEEARGADVPPGWVREED